MSALKMFIEAIVLLFAWVLVIYCQDFFSLLVFITLCIYTFTITSKSKSNSTTAFNTVVMFCIVTLVIVYLFTLSNLSSYNSPRKLPNQMFFEEKIDGLNVTTSVYPNKEKMVFSIPFSMQFYSWKNDTNIPHGVVDTPVTNPTCVDIQVSNYCGFYWTNEKMQKRAWFVLVMWLILVIYYRYYKLWILQEDI